MYSDHKSCLAFHDDQQQANVNFSQTTENFMTGDFGLLFEKLIEMCLDYK